MKSQNRESIFDSRPRNLAELTAQTCATVTQVDARYDAHSQCSTDHAAAASSGVTLSIGSAEESDVIIRKTRVEIDWESISTVPLPE